MNLGRFYSGLMNPMYESVNMDDYIVATYLVGAKRHEDPIVKASSIAVEQTTGSWADIATETDEIREKYAGKVFGVYEVPDFLNGHDLELYKEEVRFYVMRIGFPVVNFKNNLPLMLSAVLGNITALPMLKCLDVEFPESFTADFQGPKFGIEGIREITGVHGRPLLNNMIKPCTGWTPEHGAQLFYDAAVGGVDWIKDDELIGGNTSFNAIVDRVKQNMAMAEKANKIKGESTIYSVNITDEVFNLKRNAMAAIEAGANAIMIDVFCTGFSALRMLAEDPEIQVPILAHPCYSGASIASPENGVDYNVYAKLCRLCGADVQLVGTPYGKFDVLKYATISHMNHMRNKFYDIKPSMPLFGGGTIPGNAQIIIQETGIDSIMGVGAGIHAFPNGPTAGARAMRAAIDCGVNNKDIRKEAETNEDLRVALATWGLVGEDDIKKNFLI
ncbi:MAG: RuBisCO large subunit C-terminal-like domain-containing protein [Lachnospiraceae bacterium]